jgi:hypothetical protein
MYQIKKISTINKAVLLQIKSLFFIICVGLVSSIFHIIDVNKYFMARDFLYFIQAPIFILIGIYSYLFVKDIKIILRVALITSFILTVNNLSSLVTNPALIFEVGLKTRYEYNFSNETAQLSFIIMLFSRIFRYKIFNKYFEILIITISLFSILISFSRTYYALLLIAYLIPYANNKIIMLCYWMSISMILFILCGSFIFDISAGGEQGFTFESKILHSFDELIVHDYADASEINHNWRGYEAYLGLSKFSQGNAGEILLGQGFGAIVKTPFWLFQGEKLETIPIFHNGYLTIILKSGLIGLLLFFNFLYTILKKAVKFSITAISIEQKCLAVLLQAIVFIILFQTLVVHGIFKTTVPIMLLILTGALIQYLEINKNLYSLKGN